MFSNVDFSHLRSKIPYQNDTNVIPTAHVRACIDARVLSTYPIDTACSFQEDPYRIFRALKNICSGFNLLDRPMFDALNDVEFCFNSTLKLPSKRRLGGIGRVLSTAHPCIALAIIKKYGWLKQNFPEANQNYELTLKRMFYVHAQLINLHLEKDIAVIYALLLWPSFSVFKVGKLHYNRVQTFFIDNNEKGICFPGKPVLKKLEEKKTQRKVNSDFFVVENPETNEINSDQFVFENQQKSPEDLGLQTKISLLFYWLSKHFKFYNDEHGEEEYSLLSKLIPSDTFSALGNVQQTEKLLAVKDLIKLYIPCRKILAEAFSTQEFEEVNMQVLIKNSIYSLNNHSVPKGAQKYEHIGAVENYFKKINL